jgi:hypothetical protein
LAANTGDDCNKDGATGEKDKPETTVTTPAKRCAPFKKCLNPWVHAKKSPRNNNTKTLIGLKNSQMSLEGYRIQNGKKFFYTADFETNSTYLVASQAAPGVGL